MSVCVSERKMVVSGGWGGGEVAHHPAPLLLFMSTDLFQSPLSPL